MDTSTTPLSSLYTDDIIKAQMILFPFPGSHRLQLQRVTKMPGDLDPRVTGTSSAPAAISGSAPDTAEPPSPLPEFGGTPGPNKHNQDHPANGYCWGLGVTNQSPVTVTSPFFAFCSLFFPTERREEGSD